MKLAALIGTAQRDWEDLRSFVLEAERIGIDSVWSAEFHGHDALTPLAFIAGQTKTIGLGTGVVTIGGRTLATLAMSAVSLAAMSNGRFRLGLGANGREMIENWQGARFHPASTHLRETAEVVRRVASGLPLEYSGTIYRLPRDPAFALAMEEGLATSFPVYFASLSPKSLEATGAVADGWVGGASFGPELAGYFLEAINRGARLSGRSLERFDFMAPGFLFPNRDVALTAGRQFLVGLLGKQGDWAYSHHTAVYERAGYGDLITEIKGRLTSGSLEDAARLLPESLVLNRCLTGTDEDIRQVLRSYRQSGVTTVQAVGLNPRLTRSIDPLTRVKALLDEVNAE